MAQQLAQLTSTRAAFVAQIHEQRQWYFACKRVFDIVVAGFLLLVLSPLMLVVAILVVLDTSGSAIFMQQRVGLKRRTERSRATWNFDTFTFYKFRTMYHDADPALHRTYVQAFIQNDNEGMAAVQGDEVQIRKLVCDPRVTRLGALLRKTSLDELPQLWNVIKGDMSLVGPRPPIPYEVEMYEPWHFRRLEAKPGITGLWQVTARSSAGFDECVKLDIQYIETQSFWLDLKIVLMTPLTVLQGRGAV